MEGKNEMKIDSNTPSRYFSIPISLKIMPMCLCIYFFPGYSSPWPQSEPVFP